MVYVGGRQNRILHVSSPRDRFKNLGVVMGAVMHSPSHSLRAGYAHCMMKVARSAMHVSAVHASTPIVAETIR